jgi:hypothetical protein
VIDLHSTVCGTPLRWCDHRVSRIAVYDESDRLIADVRLSAGTSDHSGTECGRAILQALARGPMAAGELSAASGFTGGWFRAVLAAMLTSGRVVKDGRTYRLPTPENPAGE